MVQKDFPEFAKGSTPLPFSNHEENAAEELVGRRVRIFWPNVGEFYSGTVVRLNDSKKFKNEGSHVVRYDDDLKEYFEWLSGIPPVGKALEQYEFEDQLY